MRCLRCAWSSAHLCLCRFVSSFYPLKATPYTYVVVQTLKALALMHSDRRQEAIVLIKVSDVLKSPRRYNLTSLFVAMHTVQTVIGAKDLPIDDHLLSTICRTLRQLGLGM